MVLNNSHTNAKFHFVKAYRAIWVGIGITFAVSILFLVGTFVSPGAVLYASIIIGGLSYLCLSGLLIYEATQYLPPNLGNSDPTATWSSCWPWFCWQSGS